MTRAPLNMEEFSAIAFIRSSLPTMSTRNDCRPGISKALTTPSSAASTNTCQTCTRCVSVSAARTKASSIDATWVAMTMCLRLLRSATIPPNRATGTPESGWRILRRPALIPSRQPVDKPRLRNGLHPSADQRNQLSAEKKLEVAMPQRPSCRLPAQTTPVAGGILWNGSLGSATDPIG